MKAATSSWRSLAMALLAACGLALGLLLPGAIGLGLLSAWRVAPEPQAIVMLGGSSQRERFTAQFAQTHPLPVWVSSGIARSRAQPIFDAAGIRGDRLHLDYQAVDTVTNFSTLVGQLQRQGVRHVYLVTSDFHMGRARAIATVIFGSRGIAFTPVKVPSTHPPESWLHIARDVGRAAFWTFAGWAGEQLNPRYAQRRATAQRDALLVP